MKLRTPRVLPAVLMAAAAALPVQAQDWGQLATISTTLGVNANRFCVGEGLRSDIGCPSYAPSLTSAGDVSITGNLSANAFIGDGSGLTGVASGDRIVSGTTNVIAAQDRSVTISTAGTQRVTIGENGNVGIGTTAPSSTLDVVSHSAANYTTLLNVGVSTSVGAQLQIRGADATLQSENGRYLILHGKTGLYFQTNSGNRLFINSTGSVGIGNTSPQATLQVSGSFTVSSTGQTTTPSVFVATNGSVGIGTSNPNSSYLMDIGTASGANQMRVNGGSGATLALSGNTFGQVLSSAGSFYLTNNAANDIIFRTNSSSEKLRIMNSGNVGIGTAAPQATLQVSGSFTVSNSAQTTTPTLFANASGNIGIGTNNPTTALDISFTNSSIKADASGLQVFGTSTANPRIKLASSAVGATAGLTLGHESWGTLASTGSGIAIPTFRQLGLYTANNTFLEERIRILGPVGTYLGNGGLVGINTSPSTPSSTLHVSGTLRVTSWTAIAANVTPTTALDVYGTVSATNFVGDGSGLTGITAASSDRITSGTTNVIANNNSGYVSFTSAGTTTGFYSPGGIFAAVGISTSSNQASFTTVYASQRVGAGMTASSYPMEVYGDVRIDNNGVLRFRNGSTQYMTIQSAGAGASIYNAPGAGLFSIYNQDATNALRFGTNNTERLRIDASGNVGIGTTSPGKTLDVSGTAQIISRTLVGGTGTPSATLQVSGSMLLAGNDNIPCTDSALGLVRRNPTTGRLQACR